MERLPPIGLVDPNGRVGGVEPDIAHVTEQITRRVLRSCGTELRTDAREQPSALHLGEPLDGNATKQRETGAVRQSPSKGSELRAQRGQREALVRFGGGDQFVDLVVVGEVPGPLAAVGDLVTVPDIWS